MNLISGLWSARVRKDLRKKMGSAEELTFPFCSFQIDIKGITSMFMKQYAHYIVHADVALLKNNSY